jgi:hypothetical protein
MLKMSDSAEANQEVTNVVTEALLGPVALFESHSTGKIKKGTTNRREWTQSNRQKYLTQRLKAAKVKPNTE